MKIHTLSQRLIRSLILVVTVVGAITLFTNLSFAGGPTVASAAESSLTYDSTTKTLTFGPGDFPTDYRDKVAANQAETIVFVTESKSSNKVIAPVDSSNLFQGLINLKQMKGMANFDTSNVKQMNQMFAGCTSLSKLDLSSFDTQNVEEMAFMFAACTKLIALDVSSFDTSAVEIMNEMFEACSSLQTLDLRTFEINDNKTFTGLFYGTSAMWKLTLGPKVDLRDFDIALANPIVDTVFNHNLKVNSTKWLHKIGGSDLNPTGDYEYTADEIKTAHTLGNTDTYVWQGDLGNTTVEYVVQPSYTITIPATITIPSATVAGTGNVTLSAYPKVPYEERFIHISATSGGNNQWHLTTTGDATGAEYDFTAEGGVNFKNGDDLVIEADVEAPATVKTNSASLTDNTHKFKYAGAYMDTVTFTIQTADSE
ncbi:MAG: DUF285 domain-containing protein [Lactobacillaceae bacterium]|jgi:surface protein|nr:DUF285 domain-containing protein [Lactobacillaceae bacterium]